MKIAFSFVVCLLCLAFSCALPTKPENEANTKTKSKFASAASQLIATQLLKFGMDIDGNQVHSPLGVSTILAVLSEGAAGETYEEFKKVFGDAKERSDLRSSFKETLANYQNKNYGAAEPSFQTWFYVYRNNSAREEFKRQVLENYFVEVKDISREEYDWSEPNTSLSLDSASSESSNSKDVIGFETLKRLKLDDVPDEVPVGTDNYGEEVLDKEASKFDRDVDDKQYVEKPVALAEIAEQQQEKQESVVALTEEKLDGTTEAELATTAAAAEKLEKPANDFEQSEKNLLQKVQIKREEDVNIEENETVQEDEKLHKSYSEQDNVPIQEVLGSNEPEKVTLPLQKLENVLEHAATKGAEEIMLALESHLTSVSRAYGARSLFRKDDIASALSANSITGRKAGSKTKMLLFNGLYYRGSWAQPFYQYPNADDEYFFMTNDDVMKTPMMHSKGQFNVAELEHLNARAISIPYQNKKYALAIALPNEAEGLNTLIEKIQPSDFEYARSHAKLLDLHVSMPKFQVEETSRSEAMLKNLGLQKLFSASDADLSLLSDDEDLHIDEIVQFVNMRVDEGAASVNALSAGNSEGRTVLPTVVEEDLPKFEVNRPFLYFVIDREDQFVIASGKICAPEYKEDPSVSIEVELDQA